MAQYVYGKNVVKQLILDQKKIHQLILSKETPWKEGEELAATYKIQVIYADKKQINTYAEGNHQGVIAKVDDFKTYSLDEVVKSAQNNGLFVMLDGLEDPHNLGAILRSADASGVDGIILPKRRSVGLTPVVAKVSTGAIDTVKTAEVTNLTASLKELKKAGYWVVGASSTPESVDYRSVDYTGKIVLVVGSEGFGLSRLVEENCDFIVHLPMLGKVTSLNASVATGILLYEVLNQRYPFKK